MVGWHHRLDGHELEQTLGDGEGHGRLACSSPWGHKDLDVTQRLNNNKDESDYMTIWKKQSCRDSQMMTGQWGGNGSAMNEWMKSFLWAVKLLCRTV